MYYKNEPRFNGVYSRDSLPKRPYKKKQKRKYIRTIQEISKKPTDDSKIKYVSSDLMEKIIKKL